MTAIGRANNELPKEKAVLQYLNSVVTDENHSGLLEAIHEHLRKEKTIRKEQTDTFTWNGNPCIFLRNFPNI